MKRKIIVVSILLVSFVVILHFLEKKTENKKPEVNEKVEVIVDVSALESQVYLNEKKVKKYLEEYLRENQIQCKNATAINFRYEDLDTADIVYDVYFMLDDEDKTLLTLSYQPIPNSPKVHIKVKPCEYTYNDIITQAWYKEDYQ